MAPEDTVRQAEKQVQDLYEQKSAQLELLFKNKEKELLKN